MEIDKLKAVARRNKLADGSRRETTAEHSWHAAVMAMVLADDAGVDRGRVTAMMLVHDLVEIDAGDTFCYDAAAHGDKDARERAAAARLFGMLPDDQTTTLRSLWDEFEDGTTPEAKLARALDRVAPLILNYAGGGGSWAEHGIREAQVRARMEDVRTGAPQLWPFVDAVIRDSMAKGWIKP